MTVPPDQRVAPLVGVQGFRSTPLRVYDAAAVADFNYASPSTVFVLFSYNGKVLGSSVRAIARHNVVSQGGWLFYNWNGDFVAQTGGSGSSQSTSVAHDPAPGECLIGAFSNDGSALRFRLSSIGTDSVVAAAPQTASPDKLRIGNNNTAAQHNDAFPTYAILGTGSAALSDADMLTTINELIDNAEQGRSLDAGLSVFAPEDYVDLADAWQGPGAPLKATVNARVGTSSFTKVGEPQAASIPARF